MRTNRLCPYKNKISQPNRRPIPCPPPCQRRRRPTITTDVIIIGTGAAGGTLALQAEKLPSSTACSPGASGSGAHFNPAVTVTYYRLGKIDPRDAFYYVVFQFAGGIAGVGVAAAVFGDALASPNVDYIVTVPELGSNGIVVAFVGEFVISFHALHHQQFTSCRLYRVDRWCSGGHLRSGRSPVLGYEHESGPHSGLCLFCRRLDWLVDLFCCAPARHAHGSGVVCSRSR